MSRRYPVSELYEERDREVFRNGRDREYDEVDVIRRREPDRRRDLDFLREDYARPAAGPLIVRERTEETYARPRDRERERERPCEREREEIDIVRSRSAPREHERDREDWEFLRARDRPRERDTTEIEITRQRSRPRERERDTTEIDIIRSPSRRRERTPEPEIIREPDIHQNIVTHHYNIDHGTRRLPSPSPPSPRRPPSPPVREFEEIDIRKRGMRGGRPYDDELIIREREGERRRPRSPSIPRAFSRSEPDIVAEADFYNRRADDRRYIGEAYNGTTRDWSIVDVPPGTKRVQMDGVGGASEEITWQRYNGVRRSKFLPDGPPEPLREERREEKEIIIADTPRRYVGQRPKQRELWTEITKDLVLKEAIEQVGYDYEETEFFFYVFEYLRYEDVSELVELSEAIRRERRDRIREIQWERDQMNERRRYPEERVIEREVIYDTRRPRGYLR